MIGFWLLILGICATVRLGAQTPVAPVVRDTTPSKDSVIADSVIADSVHRRHLRSVVVSGTRLTPSDTLHLPQRTDAISSPRKTLSPAGIADALLALPGVSVFGDQGTRIQPTLDIRGFSLSPVAGVPQGVSVFLDGVRINEPDAQEFNFDLVPMEAVDHSELTRGPTAIFGKNTLAGALTFATERGQATPSLKSSIEVGSFGYREGSVSAGGIMHGFDGYLMLKGSTEQGYQAQTPARTQQLFATVGRQSDEAHDIAVSVLYAHDSVLEAGSLPESWISVNRRANYSGGDYFQPTLWQVSVRGEHPIGAAQFHGNMFVRRNAIAQYNVNADDANTLAKILNFSYGGTGELDRLLSLRDHPLALTLGGELSRGDVRYHLFAVPNTAEPTIPDDCDVPSGLCENARIPETDAALYVQARYTLSDRLSLLVSARGDGVHVPFRDLRDSTNNGTNTFWHVSPKVGVTATLASTLRGYLSFGGGFRAPAALELACASPDSPCPLPFSLGADPPLAPVVAWNSELGATWEPSWATLTLSAFRTDVQHEIVFVNSQTASGYFQNIAQTRRDGIESSATVALPAHLRVAASYTFLDATYQSRAALASVLDSNVVQPGAQFPLSPRHRVTASVDGTIPFQRMVLDGGLTLRAVSSQFFRGDEANHMSPLAGYGVLGLHMDVERTHWQLSADIDNFLNRQYNLYGIYAENAAGPYGGVAPSEPVVERFYTPAYGRNFTLRMTLMR